MKKYSDYSIGVDIGTGSVGWAVIDGNYKLCKFKGKDAWGAFVFDDAKTAVSRRDFRAQRRRNERKKERIRLLQELMSDLVLAKDDSFYIRLKESSLRSDIVGDNYKRSNYYNLFDGEYTDKDYYNDYPTIYHLRDFLCSSQNKADIRLVYLALHHILKYRGNFLYEGKNLDTSKSMLAESFAELFILLEKYQIENCNYLSKIDEMTGILKNKTFSKSIKIDKLKEILCDKKYGKNYQAIISLIMGNTATLSDALFLSEPLMNDEDKPIKISFANEKYESEEESYLSLAESEDRKELLLNLKYIYTSSLFENITGGESRISKVMIKKYEKHQQDLKIFKNLLKEGFSVQMNPDTGKPHHSEYSKMFRRKSGKNYVNYIGSKNNACHHEKRLKQDDGKKTVKQDEDKKRVTKDEFYESVKKVLAKLPESDKKTYCLNQIELDNFLPLINSVENSSIPYQMHKKELELIIDNQSKFYPELANIKDKIISILTFKRPYYVGPLKGEYSWCEQTINERITPWNFYDLVDTEQLADKFIVKMTNYCNVFKDEKVLPLKSIIYQAYITLNEINKLKYKDKIICTDWKKTIFIELCCKQKTVKLKNIVAKLKNKYNLDVQESDISGLADDKLNGTMSSYIDFKKLNNFDLKNIDNYEETIRILTIFNDEKIIKSRLRKLECYDEKQIKSLSKMSFSGWGRYSEKLLNGIKGKGGKTIVQTLYDSDKNINELLFNNEFGFANQVVAEKTNIEYFDYSRDIEPLYCSPSVKKAVWNALKLIEEIAKVAKCSPNRIFLEDTHTIQEKVKTDSRIAHLNELYKVIEKNEYFNKDCYDKVKELKANNKKLDSDKLYLWLIQLGKCMYTGEVIELDQLNECEIDHIVPRSYIKDDSFENRVLVKKIENQQKTNTLSISPLIQTRMYNYWQFLYEHKFVGNKKLFNLTRGEYTEEDKIGFINRQLVETSQIIKEVRKILEKRFPKATIRGIRAGMNSVFRNKYSKENKAGFYKIRSLNNLHHAKDAYLTAVIGQFTTVACPFWGQNDLNKAYKHYIVYNNESKHDVKTLVNKRYGLVIDLLENTNMDNFMADDEGEYLWDNERYLNIFRTMEKNNCLIVKKQCYYANSEFYNQTIYSPRSGKKNLLPLKAKNGIEMPSNVYGGYSNENSAYFAIVKYEKISKTKKETKFVLSQIPLQKVVLSKSKENAVQEYIISKYGESAKIIRLVHKFQLLKLNGHKCYLTGENEVNNAVELIIDSRFEKLLYQIENNNIRKLQEDESKTVEDIKAFILHYNDKIRKFMPLYSKFADKLDEILQKHFDNMSFENKLKLVKDMLVVANTGAGRVALDKSIGGGEYGRLSGKTIYPNEVEWINNSRTGLYSSVNKYTENN